MFLFTTMFRKSVFVSLFLVSNLIILGVATGTECPQDKPYWHSEKCNKCSSTNIEVDGTCCSSSTPYLYDSNEDDEDGTKTCNHCPENNPIKSNNQCCPKDKTYWHSGKCHKCPDSTKEVDGTCCSISTPYVYDSNEDGTKTCNHCPENNPIRISSNNQCCPKDKPHYYGGKCNKCWSSDVEVDGTCCNNRYTYHAIHKLYVYDSNGNGTKTCNQCPENSPISSSNQCCPKDKPYYYSEKCNKCSSTLIEVDGTCCNNSSPYVYDVSGSGTKTCNKCPKNQHFIAYQAALLPGKKPSPICCPKDTYYHHGSCNSCTKKETTLAACPSGNTTLWCGLGNKRVCEETCQSGAVANGVCCSISSPYVYDSNGDGKKTCNKCPENNPISPKRSNYQCCPKDKPYYYSGKCNKCWSSGVEVDGTCCDYNHPYLYDSNENGKKTCNKCPENSPIKSNKQCCPKDKPHYYGGKCNKCWSLGVEVDGTCCGNTTPYFYDSNEDDEDDKKTCNQCPENNLKTSPYNKCCPKDKPNYHASLDQCYRCPAHRPYALGSGDNTTCNTTCTEEFVANNTSFECCPTSTPYWFKEECRTACPEDTPHWYNDTCNQCPEDTPHQYNDTCNQCLENEEFDTETKKCTPITTDDTEEEEDDEKEEEKDDEDEGGEGTGSVQ